MCAPTPNTTRWFAAGNERTIVEAGALEGEESVSGRPVRIVGRFGPLPVVLAGTFMITLDFFIVNVAIPSIQADLHASSSAVEWVVAGYGLTFAIFLITAGRLGDRFGRRRMFALGLFLFSVASAACGAAPDSQTLIAARVGQGIAAAMISPQVLSIIGVVYQGQSRLRALSIWGTTMGFAAAGGQLIGGLVTQADVGGLGWRWCFLINLPVGGLALYLTPRLVPESRAEQPRRPDLAGMLLITVALTAVVLPLIEGRQQGWPTWTWLSLAASPFASAAFIFHQRWLTRRGGDPLLDLALFGERAFSAGLLIQLTFWSGMASFFLVLAIYLQEGRGLNAMEAGSVFTILAVAYLVAALRAPRLVFRYGRGLVAAAALVVAIGHGVLLAGLSVVGTDGAIAALVPGLLLIGTGMGLAIAPLAGTVLANLQPERAGAASGLLSTMQQVGNALYSSLSRRLHASCRDCESRPAETARTDAYDPQLMMAVG